MLQELIHIKEYCVITFQSTSHALKAEKIMKQKQRQVLMTPTLREISSSCGLSLKFKPEELPTIYNDLLANHVAVDEIYAVEVVNERKNMISKIEAAAI